MVKPVYAECQTSPYLSKMDIFVTALQQMVLSLPVSPVFRFPLQTVIAVCPAGEVESAKYKEK